jgi:hypothetical protein
MLVAAVAAVTVTVAVVMVLAVLVGADMVGTVAQDPRLLVLHTRAAVAGPGLNGADLTVATALLAVRELWSSLTPTHTNKLLVLQVPRRLVT